MIELTNLEDNRILVTGGAGFIGSEVVKQLIKKNSFVTVLDNFSSGKKQYLPKKSKKLKIIKGNITDGKIVAKTVRDQDFVILWLHFLSFLIHFIILQIFLMLIQLVVLTYFGNPYSQKQLQDLFIFLQVRFMVLHNMFQCMKIILHHHIQHMR